MKLHEFQNYRDDVTYIECRDEVDLLRKFVHEWSVIEVDVITGWNTEFFDIPYLCNRLAKVFDEKVCQELSPLGVEFMIVKFIRWDANIKYIRSMVLLL